MIRLTWCKRKAPQKHVTESKIHVLSLSMSNKKLWRTVKTSLQCMFLCRPTFGIFWPLATKFSRKMLYIYCKMFQEKRFVRFSRRFHYTVATSCLSYCSDHVGCRTYNFRTINCLPDNNECMTSTMEHWLCSCFVSVTRRLICLVLFFCGYIFNFIHQNGSKNKQNINLTNLTKVLRSPQFITMITQCTDHHLTYSSLQ